MEQKARQATYAFKNGARNIAWVIGFVEDLTPRGGVLIQTRNTNLGLPFQLQPHDRLPRTIKQGKLVKLVARVEGGRDERTGEPTAILRVLAVDTPKVIELPPQRVWDIPTPEGAPASGITPKASQVAPNLDKNQSNVVKVAGVVTGIRLRKAGMVQSDGTQSNACLYLLLQQSADPKDAIPVRLYGAKAPQYHARLVIGRAVAIRSGKLRMDVKEVEPADGGAEAEGAIAEVTKHAYVFTEDLHEPDDTDFSARDDWVKQDWVVDLRKATLAKLAERQQARAPARVLQDVEPGAPVRQDLSADEVMAVLNHAAPAGAQIQA